MRIDWLASCMLIVSVYNIGVLHQALDRTLLGVEPGEQDIYPRRLGTLPQHAGQANGTPSAACHKRNENATRTVCVYVRRACAMLRPVIPSHPLLPPSRLNTYPHWKTKQQSQKIQTLDREAPNAREGRHVIRPVASCASRSRVVTVREQAEIQAIVMPCGPETASLDARRARDASTPPAVTEESFNGGARWCWDR